MGFASMPDEIISSVFVHFAFFPNYKLKVLVTYLLLIFGYTVSTILYYSLFDCNDTTALARFFINISLS